MEVPAIFDPVIGGLMAFPGDVKRGDVIISLNVIDTRV